MTAEKAAYAQVCIGPGGRDCPCCAPKPSLLKRWEHRKARHTERKHITTELASEED